MLALLPTLYSIGNTKLAIMPTLPILCNCEKLDSGNTNYRMAWFLLHCDSMQKKPSHAVICITTVEFFTVTQNWQCWHYCQLCIPNCLQFSSLVVPIDINKLEIRNQGVKEDYISRLHTLLDQLIFTARVKMKLAMLPFLY